VVGEIEGTGCWSPGGHGQGAVGGGCWAQVRAEPEKQTQKKSGEHGEIALGTVRAGTHEKLFELKKKKREKGLIEGESAKKRKKKKNQPS